MLLIVVEHEKKEAVLGAIKEVKCLKEPGIEISLFGHVRAFARIFADGGLVILCR